MKQLTHYDIENKQQQFPVTIVCDAIRTPENIGMCFRISESFGVKKIFLHESSPSIDNRNVKRTARNTITQIEHELYTDFDQLILQLKEEGNIIIGIEIADKSINIQDFDFTSTKKIVLLLILVCFSCNNKTQKKTYLANYIDSLKTEYSLTENPLLIIDGVGAHYESMNDGWFLLRKEDISSLKYIKKGETKIYGSKDINGVVLLTTILNELQSGNENSNKKTLYVLDGKIISYEEYKKINQSKVIGIGTITEKNAIKEFSPDDYDEVIYVLTKMPTK